jgi:hypothetical protein
MQTIYNAANAIDAQRVIDLLASEAILAHVQGAYLTGGVGELPAGDMVRVWVADEDAERAREVLSRNDNNLALPDDEDDRRPEPAPSAKRGIPSGWVGLVFGLLIGYGLAYWQLRLPQETDEVDYNGDGIVDTKYEFHGERLVGSSDDRNGDERPDQVWVHGAEGASEATIDDDFDGRFEAKARYRKNQPAAVERDVDGDDFAELRSEYAHGVLIEATFSDPATGAVFKREHYEGGVLVRAEVDANRDGTFETTRRYDASGEIVP